MQPAGEARKEGRQEARADVTIDDLYRQFLKERYPLGKPADWDADAWHEEFLHWAAQNHPKEWEGASEKAFRDLISEQEEAMDFLQRDEGEATHEN